MTPIFTLIKNENDSLLQRVFIDGRTGISGSNFSGYLEDVKAHIVKDYESGHHGGFFVKIQHTQRDESKPKDAWSELPPFMRFKERADIDVYGDSSATARDIGNYIKKMAEKFDFSKGRVALCVDSGEGLKPVIAGNRKFLEGLKLKMEAYYSDYVFVISPYNLAVSA